MEAPADVAESGPALAATARDGVGIRITAPNSKSVRRRTWAWRVTLGNEIMGA
jgi:hypothetical protein